ncbi:MAG: hypothetical protein ACR2H1_05185, partial [Limisphaerales bacterium]
MKTKMLFILSAICLTLSNNLCAQLPFKPSSDRPVNSQETSELESIFSTSKLASAAVQPGTDSGAQRRAIAHERNRELENFVTNHLDSAWTPAIRLSLANDAKMHSSYVPAMNHYQETWNALKGSTNILARQMAHEASGGLAKLLALTGRINELDALETEAGTEAAGG